jgi:hypothetical protein
MAKGYLQYECELSGDSLIMHNGQTADPLNSFSKAMKEISGKRKKTDADFEALANIEYQAGLYLNAKGQVIVPSRVLESVLVEGAKKSKEGKLALSGMFVDTDGILEYDGGDMSVKQLLESPDHRICVAVRIGMSKVMRTRPHFKNWRTTFKVSINEQVANEAQLKRWLEDAGSYVGIGDWRPRHGRYELDNFAAVRVPLKKVAK